MASNKSAWDPKAERDLILAAWSSSMGGEFKTDWAKTHEVMLSWGYTFSKDAMKYVSHKDCLTPYLHGDMSYRIHMS